MPYCTNYGAFMPNDDGYESAQPRVARSNKDMPLMSVLFSLEGRTKRSTRWLQGMLPLLSITFFFLIFVFGPLNEEITSLLIPLVVSVVWLLALALSVELWGDWNRIRHDRNQNRARPGLILSEVLEQSLKGFP